MSDLREQPLEALQRLAWQQRRESFPDRITFSVPGSKRYDTTYYANRRHSFVEISLTGQRCALGCKHCGGKLLAHMRPATTPEELIRLASRLTRKGCAGILLSGGANERGQIDFAPFYDAIAEITGGGMRVLAHTGLLDEPTSRGLRAAGVHQVLLDVIGDDETIREVYGLGRTAQDYRASLRHARDAGLSMAPHIVLGLHGGRMRGEYRALAFVTELEVGALVIIVLRPLPGTPYADHATPSEEEVGRYLAVARLLNPNAHLALGCARPGGAAGRGIEKVALQAGVNAIAFPSTASITLARRLSLAASFEEACCSLSSRI